MCDGGIPCYRKGTVPSALRHVVRAATDRIPCSAAFAERRPHHHGNRSASVQGIASNEKGVRSTSLNAVVWIPDSKTPNGISEIPLTKLALEAFRNQVAISGNGDFLFPSDLNHEGHLQVPARRHGEML